MGEPSTYRGTIKRVINESSPKLRMMAFVALDGGYEGKAEDCMVIPSRWDKACQHELQDWSELRVGQRLEFDGVERHPKGLRAINARFLRNGTN